MWDLNKPGVRVDVIMSLAKLLFMSGLSYLAFSYVFKQLDPTNNKQKQQAKEKAEKQLKKIGKKDLQLTEYELLMASHLVMPNEINVAWTDIAGLDDVLDEINETVIFPIKESRMLAHSKLAKPPKGVLLHGPPGCGKTLIAKATAKEAVTSFINLDISMLTDKWYGESQKLVTALFSLAEKLQPCIIFIDEIDSLLRSRSSQDHEATAMMKAQFMFLWDGLITDTDKTVIVMGATNRPQDLDAAIRRRMPATFFIPLPGDKQRQAILQLVLNSEQVDGISYQELVEDTNGFSGSDLWELCRQAALYCVRDCAQRQRDANSTHRPEHQAEVESKPTWANEIQGGSERSWLRPIMMSDLRKALANMKVTKCINDRHLLE